MVKIEAVIRPHLLDTLIRPLMSAGVRGLTVSEVKIAGDEKHLESYRGTEYEVSLIPKLKLEIVVKDEDAERVVQALYTGAHTGRIGDGTILVEPVYEAIQIRTGVRGDFALL